MRFWIACYLIALFALPACFCGCKSLNPNNRLLEKSEKDGLLGIRRRGKRAFDPNESLDPMGERHADRLTLDDLTPGNIQNTIQTRLLDEYNPEEAERFYAEAEQIFEQASATVKQNPEGKEHVDQFLEAGKKFRLSASRWPESKLEEDALFFEGQSYFFANHYVDSNRAYEKLISLYSGTRYLDRAEQHRFAIALFWLDLSKQGNSIALNNPQRPRVNLQSEARRILHRIRIDDPTGRFADDATNALGDAYFADKRWPEAADAYEDLRRNYPHSPFQYHAHLFELKSRLESYQGGSYDDIPLRKADELMRIIVNVFPNDAQEDKDFLAEEATRIQSLLAERDLEMAQYFEDRGENRAAKIYYEELAENYGDTKLANSIEQKITEVGSKPPTPPQYGKWFVDLFPDPNSEKPVLTAGNEKIFK